MSVVDTMSGYTDFTSGHPVTTSGQMNGQAITTSGQTTVDIGADRHCYSGQTNPTRRTGTTSKLASTTSE